MLRQNIFIVLNIVLMVSSAAGCSGWGSETVTVLAGSELRDLEPLFDQIQENTGLRLEMAYIGSRAGAEQLSAGAAVDLAWFSQDEYLLLLRDAGNSIAAQEEIMLSPVVLGVKESKARTWGWIDNPKVTWRDIMHKANAGELRFAMSNPAASNSGFSALLGVAAALTDTHGIVAAAEIDNESLGAFFRGQALIAGSSGWLAEAYVREQERLDGMVNYESVLLALNAGQELHEKLYLIYPLEGVIIADYPLMLINANKRQQYEKLVAYLRSPAFQQAMMEQTLRRPVNPQVPLNKISHFDRQGCSSSDAR